MLKMRLSQGLVSFEPDFEILHAGRVVSVGDFRGSVAEVTTICTSTDFAQISVLSLYRCGSVFSLYFSCTD